jgi:hypothetical protein
MRITLNKDAVIGEGSGKVRENGRRVKMHGNNRRRLVENNNDKPGIFYPISARLPPQKPRV